MRLVTCSYSGRTRLGALVERAGHERVVDLTALRPELPADMVGLLALGEPGLKEIAAALAGNVESGLLPENEVTLLAPVPRPGKIICLGHNYVDHTAGGAGAPLPEYPTIFAKWANCVIGPGQAIAIPEMSREVDWEAELAVVIGATAREVPEDEALRYVAGYTAFNDVSARDVVRRSTQWTLGKAFDTFGPMGPALVTTDEIGDPGSLDLALSVNGQEMQRSNTRHMIFSIPFLIAYLSRVMTLEPGDLISTGTPKGSGAGRKPPIFLRPGDEVSLWIEKIGTLRNPVAGAAPR